MRVDERTAPGVLQMIVQAGSRYGTEWVQIIIDHDPSGTVSVEIEEFTATVQEKRTFTIEKAPK